MEMQGNRTLAVSQQQAWDALNDPEVLKACVPGCDKLERTADDQFSVGMTVKIGPVSAKFAGKIARDSGLADQSGWCPIDPTSFESRLVKGIHVVGDATIAAPMPKSGFAANSQGKVAAAAAVAMLQGKALGPIGMVNTCYSHVGKDYAISVANVFRVVPDRSEEHTSELQSH